MGPDLTVQTGFAVMDEPSFRGTLVDHAGGPLAGWTVALRALDGTGVPLDQGELRGAIAEADGAFNVTMPSGTVSVRAEAYHPEDDTHAIPSPVTVLPDGALRVAVPVKRQHGLAFLQGTTTLLKRHGIAWRDTSDATAWQGTVTDTEGRYSLYEEQGRPYTVYAFSEVSKAWYILTSVRENQDGSRDLFFALWSFMSHPFARRDNPLGGAPANPRF